MNIQHDNLILHVFINSAYNSFFIFSFCDKSKMNLRPQTIFAVFFILEVTKLFVITEYLICIKWDTVFPQAPCPGAGFGQCGVKVCKVSKAEKTF